MRFEGKTGIVTGGSRGIGRACVAQLAREGAKLVICARDKKTLEKTADEIFLETGVSVFPLSVNLMESEQIDWLVDETMDLYGKIDILVTNAGGPPPGDFNDLIDSGTVEILF